MLLTYSVLVTDEELLISPEINELRRAYDITLGVNQPTITNFLLQHPLSEEEAQYVHMIYDRDTLETDRLYIERYTKQSLFSVELTAKELGSQIIQIFVPYRTTNQERIEELVTQ